MAMAEALQELTLRIEARYCMGLPRMQRGDFRAAIDLFQRDVGLDPERLKGHLLEPPATEAFQGTSTRYSYCFFAGHTAYCFAELGEFDQALLHGASAVKFANSVDALPLRAHAQASLGSVYLRQGDLQRALHQAQSWLRDYVSSDLPMPRLIMVGRLGEVFNVLDHVDDALSLLDAASRFAESKGLLGVWPRILALLGDAYGRAGRVDEALAAGQRALDLTRQFGQRGDEARALYLMGNIQGYGTCTHAAQAREHYQQALLRAHQLSMRPLEAQSHLALGELARKTGHKQEAQEQFTVALTMFREMGMQTWPEQAESALRAL
jgi:tetratricopeptide (TPR) repeat protein